MAQNFDTLTDEIGLVVTRIVSTDLALLRGYSQAKARAIASFTLLLGEGYASGSIGEEQMAQEADELERMVVRFVRNIQALATTTIERLLRGIGDLLMTTLRQVTGVPSLTLAPSTGVVWGVGPAA
jgi:enamine deaminase RidA (YjgF/YER057c/UK114 family)